MIHINPTGVILALISFGLIIFLSIVFESKTKKFSASDLEKRLNNIDEQSLKKEELIQKSKEGFFKQLEEAEIKTNPIMILLLIGVSTIVLYFLTYTVFKQPLVALAPLPFTLYFLPQLIVGAKKAAILKKFEEELVVVLRRMASILQTGSVLQALEEVRNIHTLSPKMRLLIEEVYHNVKYGDTIEDAFYKAAKDIPSENLKIAIISIDLNKELGADLSGSLNNISLRIQNKHLMEQEAQTLMASTIMIGRVLSIAPFLILGWLAYSNPDYYSGYLANVNNQVTFMMMIFVMFMGIYIINKQDKTNMR